MAEAKKKKQAQAAFDRSPEGVAARQAVERKQDAIWAAQMADRLFLEKRAIMGMINARFEKPWQEMTLGQLRAALPQHRDLALVIAYGRMSMEAYRAAMTLVAFEADLSTTGLARLHAVVAEKLPIQLYESNDRPRLEREHAERTEGLAIEAYRLALVKAFAEVSVIDSVANPKAAPVAEVTKSEASEVGPLADKGEQIKRPLGEYEGKTAATEDSGAPMESGGLAGIDHPIVDEYAQRRDALVADAARASEEFGDDACEGSLGDVGHE